jgi:hypothetical protein
MQKVEEVIKGLEYLSDADKERILKARGLEMPEISAKAQHKNEREEARKMEERDFMNGTTTPVQPAMKNDERSGYAKPSQTMKLHIDIRSYDRYGGVFQLEGDICNQEDLAAVHERFKDHMPRKRLWGLF